MATIGIDLGTTSIKICIVLNETIELERSAYHNANIEGKIGVQDPVIIIKTAEKLLQEAWLEFQEVHLQEKCKSLRIAGQMHAIVLWNAERLLEGQLDCSPLYTWMYPNCLEKMENLPSPSRPVYPGFGALTLLELTDYSTWNRCGTIMDLFACYLCNLKTVEMSWQLAESWSYCSDSRWDPALVERTEGKIELPRIVNDSRYVVGNIKRLKKLEDVPLLISIGDLQGSVRSVADGMEDAGYLILGTSSQICMISSTTCQIPTVDHLPYSLSHQILAGRSMNGGNAIENFLEMVSGWSSTLTGVSATQIDVGRLLEEVDAEANQASIVGVKPTFIQERGFPLVGASISGLQRATGIVEMLQSLCSGVVDNLLTLFPLEAMFSLGIRRLFLVGNAKKPRFSRRIRELCEKAGIETIDAENDTSAAYGAAIFE